MLKWSEPREREATCCGTIWGLAEKLEAREGGIKVTVGTLNGSKSLFYSELPETFEA